MAVMDFESTKPIASFAVPIHEPDVEEMAKKILAFITPESGLKRLVIGLESTSFYGVHIANYLSTFHELMPFHTEVYCLNPKSIANYKKFYIGLSQNDYIDAFIITNFARVGRITTKSWRGCQYLALQWLTHHRLHLRERSQQISKSTKNSQALAGSCKKSYRYKRALALTASKAISLILGLLAKNQLYSRNRVGQV